MNKDIESEFIELVESNKRLIYKIANAYCRDADDRKDIFQEIVLQLWKSFPTYNHNFAVSTWIYRIALNVSISHLRKETSKRRTHEEYNRQSELIRFDNDGTFENDSILLHKFIEKLRPLDKAVIILYLEGCKNKEIAAVLGMSESNVSTRMYRIKEILSKQFNKVNQH